MLKTGTLYPCFLFGCAMILSLVIVVDTNSWFHIPNDIIIRETKPTLYTLQFTLKEWLEGMAELIPKE